MMIAKSIDDLH